MATADTNGSSHRVVAIEGLRGYLALWVLVCHVFWASGIEIETLSGIPALLRRGDLAVDLFIIVSGFAIFMCLDTQNLGYKGFIVRRFFRLFPVFIVLFAVAIPLSWLSLWNLAQANQYLTPDQVSSRIGNVQTWWRNIQWNIPLHMLMLHGVVPESLIPRATDAFLQPAWSISLEWQFYLVAPFAFVLATSAKWADRMGLLAICVLLLLGAGWDLFPWVRYGAFLPFHLQFFILGAASYYLYKYRAACRREIYWLTSGSGVAMVLLAAMHLIAWTYVPLGLWLGFLGMVLERQSSLSSRFASLLFGNRTIQHLGRISYSVYLSHMLVMIVMQHALLVWAPQLSQQAHFSWLLLSTLTASIAGSILLYRFIEVPGIGLGRTLSRRAVADNDVRRPRAMGVPAPNTSAING